MTYVRVWLKLIPAPLAFLLIVFITVLSAHCFLMSRKDPEMKKRSETVWHANKNPAHPEDPTIVIIQLRGKELTLVLATIEQVKGQSLYRLIEEETKKKVTHIGCAAGGRIANYGIPGVKVYDIPVYYQGDDRKKGFQNFLVGCQNAASEQTVVLIHCNSSFHRAPVVLAAILMHAGYSQTEAFQAIAERRHIYPGHVVKHRDWPISEKENRHAKKFLASHLWLEDLASTIQHNSASCAAAAAVATSVSVASIDARPREKPDTQCKCNTCKKDDNNLRRCWGCHQYSCKDCSFWCTTCPKDVKSKYQVCGKCYKTNNFLKQNTRNAKVWRCKHCTEQGNFR